MFRVDYHGGNCPFQAEGVVCDSLPFYFRSRGTHWSFRVAASPDDDPVVGDLFYVSADFSDSEYMAGWIENDQALALVEMCAQMAERILPARCAEALATGFVSLHSRRDPCGYCGKRYGEHTHHVAPCPEPLPEGCLGLRCSFMTQRQIDALKSGSIADFMKVGHGSS